MRALAGICISLLCSGCIYNTSRPLADGARDRPAQDVAGDVVAANEAALDDGPGCEVCRADHQPLDQFRDAVPHDRAREASPVDKACVPVVPCQGPICGAYDTCGVQCKGDTNDSCAGVAYETWRCAYSVKHGTSTSQVCRKSDGGNPVWQVYRINPDCAKCCGVGKRTLAPGTYDPCCENSTC